MNPDLEDLNAAGTLKFKVGDWVTRLPEHRDSLWTRPTKRVVGHTHRTLSLNEFGNPVFDFAGAYNKSWDRRYFRLATSLEIAKATMTKPEESSVNPSDDDPLEQSHDDRSELDVEAVEAQFGQVEIRLEVGTKTMGGLAMRLAALEASPPVPEVSPLLRNRLDPDDGMFVDTGMEPDEAGRRYYYKKGQKDGTHTGKQGACLAWPATLEPIPTPDPATFDQDSYDQGRRNGAEAGYRNGWKGSWVGWGVAFASCLTAMAAICLGANSMKLRRAAEAQVMELEGSIDSCCVRILPYNEDSK